jgi:hypothetical protein
MADEDQQKLRGRGVTLERDARRLLALVADRALGVEP